MTSDVMEAPNLPARRGGNGYGHNHGGGNALALASDTASLKGLLEASSEKIATVLPKHLTADRLIRVALVAVSRTPLLQKCTVQSILQCVMTGAQLGLDCSGVLGSAYMVPFWNKDIRAYEATFIPGYRGLIDLARRSGQIEDIFAHPVYAEDEFDMELGADPKLVHKPNLTADRRDENIVGAYMVAFLKGNAKPHVEFMTRGDIEKIRKASKSAFDREGNPKGPWKDHFAEMARKSVVRRGIKYLPMSIELTEALSLDDASYEREDVLAARTAAAEKSSRLLDRLRPVTSRPVSENQRFEEDPEAEDRVAAQDAAEGEIIDRGEPDTAGVEAEPPANDTSESATGDRPPARRAAGQSGPTVGADVSTWARTLDALNEAAMDAGLIERELQTRVNLWVVSNGAKGKEDRKTTPAQRLELVTAVRENRLMPDGKITPKG